MLVGEARQHPRTRLEPRQGRVVERGQAGVEPRRTRVRDQPSHEVGGPLGRLPGCSGGEIVAVQHLQPDPRRQRQRHLEVRHVPDDCLARVQAPLDPGRRPAVADAADGPPLLIGRLLGLSAAPVPAVRGHPGVGAAGEPQAEQLEEPLQRRPSVRIGGRGQAHLAHRLLDRPPPVAQPLHVAETIPERPGCLLGIGDGAGRVVEDVDQPAQQVGPLQRPVRGPQHLLDRSGDGQIEPEGLRGAGRRRCEQKDEGDGGDDRALHRSSFPGV